MKTRIYLGRLYQPKMNATVHFLWSYMIMFSGTVLCLSFKSVGTTYGDTFQCNMNASLVCQTESRPVYIIISINKTTAAYCLNANCFENEGILGEYTVSNDTSVGILRLHIQKVSISDASNIFTCEGDSTSQSIQPVVKEFPTNHSAAMKINVNNNQVQIVVTSGCVLLERHVRMNWTKLKAAQNAVPEVLRASDFSQKDLLDNTVCQSTNNCGEDGFTSTLTFMNETDGTTEEYYIQCSIVVTDDNAPENIILVTNNTFNFRDSIIPVKTQEEDNKTIILIVLILVLGIPFVAQLIVAIFLHIKLSKYAETGIAVLKIFPSGIPYIGVLLIIKFYWKEYKKYKIEQYKKRQSDKSDDRTYRSSTEVSSGNKHSSAFYSRDNYKTVEDDGQIEAQSQYDSVTHTDTEFNQPTMTRGNSAVFNSYIDLPDIGTNYEHLHPQRTNSDHYTIPRW